MDKINLKISRPDNQLLKNIKVLLFSAFASFFNWFIILICLIIMGASYVWLIKPKYDFIASNQELNFRNIEYEEKVNYLKQLNEIKTLYKSIGQADKDKIDLILSSRQDLDRLKIILLREVDKAAKEQGATVDDVVITPLDNSKEKIIKIKDDNKKAIIFDKLRLVQVTFNVKGIDYEKLKKLLVRFESSLRVMDITDLNFEPKSRQASIKLVTYYLEK